MLDTEIAPAPKPDVGNVDGVFCVLNDFLPIIHTSPSIAVTGWELGMSSDVLRR